MRKIETQMIFKTGAASVAPDGAGEYWDLFDRQGNFVRVMRRGDGYVPPELYHVTVEVIATDFAGHLLVTQRAWNKRRGAGRWEFPAGSVLSGERPEQAALRELFEETGLRAQKLQKIQERRVPGMLRIAYLAYVPNLLTDPITLQIDETINYHIATIPQWHQMIANKLFDNARLAMYSEGFYRVVESKVGLAGTEPEPSEKPVTAKVVKKVTFGED